MPAIIPFIPLIASGVSGGLGILGAKKAADASKAQTQAISPLVASQADASKWALDQAKTDLPKARETLSGPLAFWNKIFSGDRNAGMSAIGPSADALARQTAMANTTQSEFAPRGGRRALMLGDKPLSTITDLNRLLLETRLNAADRVTNIGQIFAQLGLGEQSAGTGAGSSAITGALNLANMQNQNAASQAETMRGVGSSIGNALLELRRLLDKKNQPIGSNP